MRRRVIEYLPRKTARPRPTSRIIGVRYIEAARQCLRKIPTGVSSSSSSSKLMSRFTDLSRGRTRKAIPHWVSLQCATRDPQLQRRYTRLAEGALNFPDDKCRWTRDSATQASLFSLIAPPRLLPNYRASSGFLHNFFTSPCHLHL